VSQLRDPIAIKTLADNVKMQRIARNLSQEALANLAGIEYSQVSRIERGVINTSVSVIFALAQAMSIQPSQLLDISSK
jgi:transcriptional regulator with XRE-family HTH domain